MRAETTIAGARLLRRRRPAPWAVRVAVSFESQPFCRRHLPSGGRGGAFMAHRSRPTTNKRQREQARIAKRNDKAARLADRAKRSPDKSELPPGVDPALAHLRPAPQPRAPRT